MQRTSKCAESLSVPGRLCTFPCTIPLSVFDTIRVCRDANCQCGSGLSPTSWGWPSICRCLPTALNHSVPLQATPLIDHSGGAASANVDSTQWGRWARAAGGGSLAEAPEHNTPPRFHWHKERSRPLPDHRANFCQAGS